MEPTVVHFSGMQVMLMIALCAIAVLVPVWAIRRIARAVPPVYQVPGIPSGVGGLLLFRLPGCHLAGRLLGIGVHLAGGLLGIGVHLAGGLLGISPGAGRRRRAL